MKRGAESIKNQNAAAERMKSYNFVCRFACRPIRPGRIGDVAARPGLSARAAVNLPFDSLRQILYKF
jgi:hypothetical protein